MSIRRIRVMAWVFLACLLCGLVASPRAWAQKTKPGQWLPITEEEKALKEVPGNPGAPGILLYREVYTDDVASYQWNYVRIKVLTEEGRKYADVELPYLKALYDVEEIKARTIRPDGTVVPFAGKIFKKMVVRYRSVKMEAKTFTLPEVEPGCILEYQYKLQREPSLYFGTTWEIQHELFTRRARFFIRPYLQGPRNIRWNAYMSRSHADPVANQKEQTVELEVTNVPAFEKEEFMPPERMMQERVEFYYSREGAETPDDFWKRVGKEWHEAIDPFLNKRKSMEQAVAQIVSPGDAPEVKLRKIYARVQQIRNLSFEEEKTEKEEKREKLKENANVEDVWKRGYGYRPDLTRLFVALARAAGLDSSVVIISKRDTYFFLKELPDSDQLNSEIAYVRLGNQDLYLDPATPFCPLGLLPWQRTGVQGIRPAPEGGVFIKTPEPLADQASVIRKASLRLDGEGSLEGTAEVSYIGLEALERRLDNLEEDEAGRRKALEDEFKEVLPATAEVTLEQVDGWQGSEEPLVARFRLRIPEFAVATGRRLLLPLSLFHATKKNPFEHETRKYAVYFDFPYEQRDEVTIEMPDGYRTETLPQARTTNSAFGEFSLVTKSEEGRLEVRRRLRLGGYYFPPNYYSGLKNFYSAVRTGDGDQAVLQAAEVGRKQ